MVTDTETQGKGTLTKAHKKRRTEKVVMMMDAVWVAETPWRQRWRRRRQRLCRFKRVENSVWRRLPYAAHLRDLFRRTNGYKKK